MRNGTLGSITGRDQFIIAEALATALVALEQLPTTRQPTRNIADMKPVPGLVRPGLRIKLHQAGLDGRLHRSAFSGRNVLLCLS
jgi:hypothetical protein